MRTGTKNLTRNSDEDRSKKKKTKSRKRRRDSLPSSYASASEADSRSRRKNSRREPKKSERRKKESKKSDKRRSRKKRLRRDASVSSTDSDSSRSCSTCRSRSSFSERSGRSRSPVRGAKRRVKSSPRCRFKGRGRERERGRRSSRRISYDSRFRSRSCSTCSGSGRLSSSPNRNRNRSPSEDKFREDKSRPLKSVIAVTKSMEEKEEDRDKIIKAYDDFPSSRSNDNGRKKVEFGGVEKDSYNALVEDGSCMKGEEVSSSKSNSRPAKNSDVGVDDSLAHESELIKDHSKRKSEYGANDDNREADEMELLLRQKALENFRKFRGGLFPNRGSLDDRKDDTVKSESCVDSGKVGDLKELTTTGCKPTSSLEYQRVVQMGDHFNELGARSLANPPHQESIVSTSVKGNNWDPIHNHQNDSKSSKHLRSAIVSQANESPEAPNQLKRVQESSDKMPLEQTSWAKDTQNKIAEGAASVIPCPTWENEEPKSNEPVVKSVSGSQFEQKTFSRVHDGEMVQVSYKVYIPKKSPALTRRPLQR